MLLPPVVLQVNHGFFDEASRLKTRTAVSRCVRPAPNPMPMRRARLPCAARRILPSMSRPLAGVLSFSPRTLAGAIQRGPRESTPSVMVRATEMRGSSFPAGEATSNCAPLAIWNGRTKSAAGADCGASAAFSLSSTTLTEEQAVNAAQQKNRKKFFKESIAGWRNPRAGGNRVCRRAARGKMKARARCPRDRNRSARRKHRSHFHRFLFPGSRAAPR